MSQMIVVTCNGCGAIETNLSRLRSGWYHVTKDSEMGYVSNKWYIVLVHGFNYYDVDGPNCAAALINRLQKEESSGKAANRPLAPPGP